MELSDKPQCHHHNDADNCLLCGTKKLNDRAYNVNLDAPGRSQRELQQSLQSTHCRKHKMNHPCIACEAEAMAGSEQESVRRRTVENINAVSKKLWDEICKSEHAARWPGGKCHHGAYLSQVYCEVCREAEIDPDYIKTYKMYQTVVNRALTNARVVLKGEEGGKNYADIKMMADVEVWRATKRYGSDLNNALIFTIARNTAQKALADLIKEQTIFSGLDLEFATTKDREDAARLFQQCEDEQALELIANKSANPEDRKTAQRLINDYGTRVSRFASMDVMVQDESGKPGDVSAAELEIHEEEERASVHAPDVAETFEERRPALTALVATWWGDKKKVGEAMLKPDFSVRNVPGVDKSKVSRLYKIVVGEFKTLISKSLQDK